ncbi:MAG TPA: MauE/DoxX family redox-associated membrane protein [bacterium]|nr:MauE/DoxX family redox-associated membrane protein [bacterium]
MKLLSDRRLVAALRIGLGALFIAAALPKLQDPAGFAGSIDHYHLLPEAGGRILALVLPVLELLVGMCLVLGVLDAGASLLVLALMIVFTAAVGSAVARGLDISCGCFDTEGGTKVGVTKVAENLALTAAAFWVRVRDRSWLSVGALLRKPGDVE